MNIYYESPIKEIKNIVQSKAKYQKVMLLFDDSISNIVISEVYESIKETCVYNQMNIKNIDKNEIYNGYRLIIYFCKTDSFLKCDFNRAEFINVYIPQDGAILPFFLNNENHIISSEDYLFLDRSKVDLNSISSFYFNSFYNYFKNVKDGLNIGFLTNLNQEISHVNILNFIKQLPSETFCVDVDILKHGNTAFKDLIFVDLVLIDAILTLITCVKNQNLMLVDVYKSAKEDDVMIEKFYKLYNNEIFTNIILLNYNCLYNYCLKTKQKILDLIMFYEIDYEKINSVIHDVKLYAKNSNDLIAYLYLFNIFSV